MAKNAQFLELGPANIYLFILPKAILILNSVAANADVFAKAVLGGAAGNSIRVRFLDPAAPNQPLSISVSGLDITVSLATNGASTITSTANDVIAALTSDATAAFLITATKVSGQDGTGVVQAIAFTPLAGGSATGVKTDVGFLGEGVAYQVNTEAADLTGAQTGNVPQDKVVIGGAVRVIIPFKEITLDNFQIGIPSARLVENDDKSKRRIDFAVAVGRSMRASSLKMQISKIKGGFESALPQDIIIIPEISPAEGEVNFPFAPTTQREIMTNWYAWPDGATGRWSFTGDELP